MICCELTTAILRKRLRRGVLTTRSAQNLLQIFALRVVSTPRRKRF